MTSLLYIPSALIVGSLAWIATVQVRKSEGIEQLAQRINPAFADRLYPFVEHTGPSKYNDEDALWRAIGGVRGVWEIHKQAGMIATLAIRLAKQNTAAQTIAEEILVASFCLRLITPICLLEAYAHRYAPKWPRIEAWAFARLYCDLKLSLDAALTMDSGAVL